jgi:mannan endo-1,4-beta-mannosidase
MRSRLGPILLVLTLQQLGASGGAVAVAAGSTGLRAGALPTNPTSATIAMSTPGTSSSSGSALPSSSRSRASLLAFINGLSGQSRHILLGQHTNYWDSNPMDIVTRIPTLTGSQVAMIGVGNFFLGDDGVSNSLGVSPAAYAAIANSWLAGGGIVVVTQEASNPYSIGEPHADIYTAGTNANNKWNTYLDAQVAWFKQLHGAVIWRPFAEANYGHSFGYLTPAEIVLLWQYTHDYFASHGVTNVVWMLNLNAWDQRNRGSTYFNGSDYYPGSEYVDIVSMDSYPPNAGPWVTTMYNYFVTTGKPIFFGEVGSNSNDGAVAANTFDNSTILAQVKANFPKVVGMLFWCLKQGIAKQNGASTLMSDPAIITLGTLPH